jgi:hypothetical protein
MDYSDDDIYDEEEYEATNNNSILGKRRQKEQITKENVEENNNNNENLTTEDENVLQNIVNNVDNSEDSIEHFVEVVDEQFQEVNEVPLDETGEEIFSQNDDKQNDGVGNSEDAINQSVFHEINKNIQILIKRIVFLYNLRIQFMKGINFDEMIKVRQTILNRVFYFNDKLNGDKMDEENNEDNEMLVEENNEHNEMIVEEYNNIQKIINTYIFFFNGVNNNIDNTAIEKIKSYYFIFTALDSPYLNQTYILDDIKIKDLLKDLLKEKTNEQFKYKSENPKTPMCLIPTYHENLIIYIDDDGEEKKLFEFYFFYKTDENSNMAAFTKPNVFINSGNNTFDIADPVLFIYFPDLKYIPSNKYKFPTETAIKTIFKDINKDTVNNLISQLFHSGLDNNIENDSNEVSYYKDETRAMDTSSGKETDIVSVSKCPFTCFDFYANYVNYSDEEYIVSVNFPNGVNNLANESVCKYKTTEYDDFFNIMKSGEKSDPNKNPFTLSSFKKYFENYIVNYCTENHPSLKMVIFSKITELNKFMVSNMWGFVDVAGGSLFNYIVLNGENPNVVTADYDFKIYFYEHSERLQREFYIKLWFMNISHLLNEEMRKKKFLKDVVIEGSIFHKSKPDNELLEPDNELLRYKLKPIDKRHFISRGKEPPYFPVPLYSDDLLFELIIYDIKTSCKKSIKINISYFDLVFKQFEQHYIYKHYHDYNNDEMWERIYDGFVVFNKDVNTKINKDLFINTAKNVHTNNNIEKFVLDIPANSCPLFFRVPTFYEICKDVRSLRTVVDYYLPRICAGKTDKDELRIKHLLKYIQQTILSEYNSKNGAQNINSPENENDFKYIDKPDNVESLFKIPMSSLQLHILECYYQYNLFDELFCKFYENIISNSFINNFIFGNKIAQTYYTFILRNSKYSEFKNISDIDAFEFVTSIVCEDKLTEFQKLYGVTNETDVLQKLYGVIDHKIQVLTDEVGNKLGTAVANRNKLSEKMSKMGQNTKGYGTSQNTYNNYTTRILKMQQQIIDYNNLKQMFLLQLQVVVDMVLNKGSNLKNFDLETAKTIVTDLLKKGNTLDIDESKLNDDNLRIIFKIIYEKYWSPDIRHPLYSFASYITNSYTNGDILCSIKLTNGELNSVLDIINSENHVTFERVLIKNQIRNIKPPQNIIGKEDFVSYESLNQKYVVNLMQNEGGQIIKMRPRNTRKKYIKRKHGAQSKNKKSIQKSSNNKKTQKHMKPKNKHRRTPKK